MTYGERLATEKITQIRIYNGRSYSSVHEVEAGQLFAVIGLTNTTIGDGVGAHHNWAHFTMVPTLKSRVIFEANINMKEAIRIFNLLNDEDPSLHVTWDETAQEIHLHVMGVIQLEVLRQIVMERFQLVIQFEQPKILYKETVVAAVKGYGHFEPLGHYAEVHLLIEPAPRNSGIHFKNECHPDECSIGHQNLVQQHVFEREHHGILTGSPLTDVTITLLTGRAHHKHTSGGDFREATFRALRQGLEKSTNVLLEPVYHYKIKVDVGQMGRVLSDVQAAHGTFESPITEGDKAIVTGEVPVATFMEYSTQLAAYTHGKGTIQLMYAGYKPCHNQSEVIEQIGYRKDADPDYTSSSIFCAKGQGYTVKWDEAELHMHA